MTVKTKEERQGIVTQTLDKLRNSGLESEEYPAIMQLKQILTDYVNNSEDQPGFSGSIPFPEYKTRIVYLLPMRSCNQAVVHIENPLTEQSRPSSMHNGKRRQRKLTKAQQLEQERKSVQ